MTGCLMQYAFTIIISATVFLEWRIFFVKYSNNSGTNNYYQFFLDLNPKKTQYLAGCFCQNLFSFTGPTDSSVWQE